MQMILIQFTWVFGMPYSAVLTVIIRTEVEPCFVHTKTDCPKHKPLPVKNHVVCYGITVQLVANRTEAKQCLVLKYSANVGSVHCFLCLFQSLYMSDLCVASYMVHAM